MATTGTLEREKDTEQTHTSELYDARKAIIIVATTRHAVTLRDGTCDALYQIPS